MLECDVAFSSALFEAGKRMSDGQRLVVIEKHGMRLCFVKYIQLGLSGIGNI